MGDGGRALARRARARKEAEELLSPLMMGEGVAIGGVIQCGLGDWAEGPVLLSFFPVADFLAVEPVHRYCHEAWRDGFRGPIIQGALWSETGKEFEFNDFRSRTSMLDKEDRYLGKFKATSITLDDAVEFSHFSRGFPGPILLWMDCEGVELEILKGAKNTLGNTEAIVCELKDEPTFEGWPATPVVIETIESLGFKLYHRVTNNGLFLRKD